MCYPGSATTVFSITIPAGIIKLPKYSITKKFTVKAYNNNKEVIDKLYKNFFTEPDPFTTATFNIFDVSETLYK